jgi:DNA-binding response OmpR family regulator
MSHALIIDDNMIVSRALADRLASLGFDSFDHSWTEDQAVAAAGLRRPDLVVVGDTIETGSAIDAARRISIEHDVPVLMVTADSHRARRRAPSDAAIEGPFLLSEISGALACARSAVPVA